jgi:hypothetical protein
MVRKYPQEHHSTMKFTPYRYNYIPKTRMRKVTTSKWEGLVTTNLK